MKERDCVRVISTRRRYEATHSRIGFLAANASVPMAQDEMRCIAVQCTMLNELCVEWRSYWTSFPPLSLSIEHMTWVICQRDMDEGSGRADLVEVYAVGRRRRW